LDVIICKCKWLKQQSTNDASWMLPFVNYTHLGTVYNQ
jgi:hypothetical protein